MSLPISEISAANQRLRGVFNSGLTLSYEWRLQQLKSLERMFVENQDSIIGAVQKDLGKKHPLECFCTEFALVLNEIRHTISHLKGWMKPISKYTPMALQPASSSISKEPLGVVCILGTWNYACNLAIVPMVGAIAAGNCVFLKLSRHASTMAQTLGTMLPKYVDMNAVALEYEGGADMITEILKHKWDHLFFTGSVSVGRIVYEAAAKHLTPVILELGGKNPVFVDRDTNLATAARRIAWGKFFNGGQTCVGVDHAFVHRDVHDAFIEELKKAINEFYGEDPRKSTSLPRMISVHHTKRLAKLFLDGEVCVGGVADEKEQYVAPTIMKNVRKDSALLTDEIFGPILPVIAVDDLEIAAEEMKSKPSPLAVYVFSNNKQLTDSIQKKTRSGAFLVNEVIIHFANTNLPFGGVGESGIGKYHGDLTFDIFSNSRAVIRNTTAIDIPLRYPPYEDQENKSTLDRWKFKLVSMFTSTEW